MTTKNITADWGTLGKEALLFLSLPLMLLLFGTHYGMTHPAILQLGAMLLTLTGGLWFYFGKRARTPLRLALAVWSAAYLLVVIFSADPRRSLTRLFFMACMLFLFALVAELASRGWDAGLWIKSILFTGAVFSLINWIMFLSWYSQWLTVAPGQWLPSGFYRTPYANLMAPMLYITLVLAAARLLVTRTWTGRITLGLLILSLPLPLYLTSSRGGWIGTLTGLGVLAILAVLRGPAPLRALWNRIRTSRWLIVLGIIAGLLAAAAFAFLIIRESSQPTHAPLLNAREEFWPPAWEAFLSDPLTGTGPGTFLSAYLRHNSVPPKGLFGHAHGFAFNTLAEMGLIGALAFAFLTLSAIWTIWKRLSSAEGERQPLLMSALAALAAFGMHNLFDSLHFEPLALWLMIVLVAAALAELAPAAAPARPRFNLRARPWPVLALIVAAWFGQWLTQPYSQGVEAASQQNWPAARAALQQAVQRDPYAAQAHMELAMVDSQLAAAGNEAALQEAISELKTAIRLDPAWPLNYANLGALQADAGDLPAARASFEEALARSPRGALFALNLGIVTEAQGDLPAARAAYTQALQLASTWQSAPFWQESDLRKEVLSAAPALPAAKEIPALEADLAASPEMTVNYTNLATAYMSAGRSAEAQPVLDKARLAYAYYQEEHAEALWLEAELKASTGELPAALKYGQAALAMLETIGVNGPGMLEQPTYISYAFRQPSFAMDLVPQLTSISYDIRWKERAAQLAQWQQANQEVTP